MLKQVNRTLQGRQGFTLIELMVVLIVLGVLVAIAVPRLGGFEDAAGERACEANLRTIEAAAAAHRAGEGEWPEGLDDLVGGANSPSYLDEEPECPLGGDYSLNEGNAACGSCDH